jgi:hypothetical protein
VSELAIHIHVHNAVPCALHYYLLFVYCVFAWWWFVCFEGAVENPIQRSRGAGSGGGDVETGGVELKDHPPGKFAQI